MLELINRNSALLAVVLLLAAVAWTAWDYRRNKAVLAGIAVVLLVVAAGYSQARHGPSDASSLTGFDALLAAGSPVVLEVYSDTCIICLASKPAVAGLEKRLAGQLTVVHMNIGEEAGRQVAQRYSAFTTPTFIVFSRDGTERYRQLGYPDTGRLAAEALADG